MHELLSATDGPKSKLCNGGYQKNAYFMWYNNDETIEYNVKSSELLTGLSAGILEQCKNNLKTFDKDFKDWYNDLDAHKAWQTGDQIFVHCLHNKF